MGKTAPIPYGDALQALILYCGQNEQEHSLRLKTLWLFENIILFRSPKSTWHFSEAFCLGDPGC